MRHKTAKPVLSAPERLIVALDVQTLREARALVDRLIPVSTFKIGLELIFAGGVEFACELIAQGKNVFFDAKLLDIGNTVERAAANIARLGAAFLTVHATDRKTLDAAVRGRGASALKLLGLTVLTNLDAKDLDEQGIKASPREIVLRRASLAAEAGFDGVVASGHEAAAIRQALGRDFLIVTPGIRPAGTAPGDQARVMTPAQATQAGADYLVVGRPVTEAEDPLEAATAIIAEIEAAEK